jgi:hypothetical protein
LNNVDFNFEKLIDLVAVNQENEKKLYIENKHLETEKQIIQLDNKDIGLNQNNMNEVKDVTNLLASYEKTFSGAEKNYLWKMFLTYSSDNVRIILKLRL